MTEAAIIEAKPALSDSPLMSLSFQKNTQRKFKFLEGEPKALGITQICLSIFQSSCMASLIANGVDQNEALVYFIISSILIFIAGSVAVASKNLHLPTLKACVGMEIVATAASLFNLVLALVTMEEFYCFHSEYDNSTFNEGEGRYCRKVEAAHLQWFTELMVFQLTLLSISVTLAVYACKVVNCCSPAPKVPVITIQAPPAPE
ncbi:hypothetical protein NQD34_013739 [Periophthalmus magnuspinnatus]|uniref:membrane-spanning 4-domains subfamily A member 4A-like isoform X2 n=1 Tax=Periophthalmus magnuspinnatus TaxID=409849 RepID=UPI00145BA711|nr:membrane-spanning 4-domains subfamily A member 4A-like isoform X2 [Periophthalmus magnuspinnatus]KAJ0006466.1 hypothetical protein NQD34_013739 [Periophthalmus magnuspinnatus]